MKFISRVVERNETVLEKIVNTEEKLCRKWMFRNLLVHCTSIEGPIGREPSTRDIRNSISVGLRVRESC